MNRKITREAIDALPTNSVIWDTEVRGFGARRQRRDAVYIVKYRNGDGAQRVITIGRHGAGEWMPDRARKEAIRLRGLARDGQDPAEKRDAAKSSTTLAEFAARYMAEYAEPQKKLRSVVEDHRMLRTRIIPALGQTKVRDITRADVARMHAGMRAYPVSANRTLALLSAIFGWAERVGERPEHSNPCRHVDRYPEKARERLLSAIELGRLGDSLERAEQPWSDQDKEDWRRRCLAQAEAEMMPAAAREAWVLGRAPIRETAEDWRAVAAIRLLLFTGARVGEILGLQWDWIDVARGIAGCRTARRAGKISIWHLAHSRFSIPFPGWPAIRTFSLVIEPAPNS
jgi:integrase